MLKSSENTRKYKPAHLFKANINNKKDVFFLTFDSDEEFWMKQEPTDWEKVFIVEFLRGGGSVTYYFNGKDYNKLYIPFSFKRNEYPYISGSKCSKVKLEEIPLSKEKLEKMDFINQIKLDLSNISETIDEAEKALNKKLHKNRKSSTRRSLTSFFGVSSEDSKTISEPSASSSEQLAKELSN